MEQTAPIAWLWVNPNGSKEFTFVEPKFLDGSHLHAYTIMVDRKDAIVKAVSLALNGDTIFVTGKGHEKGLCRGKTEYPWDDKETIQIAVKP